MATSSATFEVDEYALCWHMNEIYECKVVEVKEGNKSSPPQYKVHYKGWNSKWDEFVDTARLLKDNPDSRKLMQESKPKKRKANAPGPGGDAKNTKKSKKGSRQTPVEEDGAESTFKLEIPRLLEQQLIYDWEQVNVHKKLVPLPRTPNVLNILNDFYNSKSKDKANVDSQEQWMDVVNGLKHYFDDAAGRMLLYAEEKKQFDVIKKQRKDVSASQIFGAEHLLRLFTLLPRILSQTSIDEEASATLQNRLEHFLKFLVRNIGHYFLMDYKTVELDG